jgi:hypothetical protein
MTLAATFLGGAKSRLLPASVPLRFFAAAAIFHVLMWIALFAGADHVATFRGGWGPALAATHLLTLGVLTTTAIGASVQLLPVATRRTLAAVWPIKLAFWLAVPGLAGLVLGMYAAALPVLIASALAATMGLLVFAVLLADNLRRAGSLPVIAAYGWTALAALLALVCLGIALAIDYEIAILPDHRSFALAHLILGGFGFMGFLALGFSHVLVPMFALASAPAKRPSFVGFLLAISALLFATLGALLDSRPMLTLACLVGLGAAAMHLWLMAHVLSTGMRKRLGLSFVLVRIAWAILPLTLLAGLAALHGLAGSNGPTLFGFLLVGGWLLTFLLGVLQRILPFLASMHAARPGASPPLVSELAASRRLKLHALCHCAALAMIGVAIASDDGMLIRLGSAIGLLGAVAFAWFTADVIRRVLPTAASFRKPRSRYPESVNTNRS